jgi:creatinine amidohydrolase
VSYHGDAYSRTHFGRLTSTAAHALLEGPPTVLLLPVGAIEPHGPHAPLATDVVIAEGICRRAARVLDGDEDVRAYVLPAIPYGVTRYAAGFTGAIHVSEQVLSALVGDICMSLLDQGFQNLLVVNHHLEPEQIAALQASLDAVEEARGVTVGYLDLTLRHRAAALPEEFRRGECHAGRYETSLVLAEAASLVDEDARCALPHVPVDMAAAIAQGHHDFGAMGMTEGYCGAPADATAAEGDRAYDLLASMVVDLAKQVVCGTGGRDSRRCARP